MLSGAKSVGRPQLSSHATITSALHGAVGGGASTASAASAAIVTDGGRVVTTDLDGGHHGLGSCVAWAVSNTARSGAAALSFLGVQYPALSKVRRWRGGGATTAQS